MATSHGTRDELFSSRVFFLVAIFCVTFETVFFVVVRCLREDYSRKHVLGIFFTVTVRLIAVINEVDRGQK